MNWWWLCCWNVRRPTCVCTRRSKKNKLFPNEKYLRENCLYLYEKRISIYICFYIRRSRRIKYVHVNVYAVIGNHEILPKMFSYQFCTAHVRCDGDVNVLKVVKTFHVFLFDFQFPFLFFHPIQLKWMKLMSGWSSIDAAALAAAARAVFINAFICNCNWDLSRWN